VYFGKRGIVLCKSRDVAIRMLSVCIVWEERERRCRQEEWIHILEFQRFLGSTCEFCWSTITKRPSLHLAEPPGASRTTSLETKFSTRREGSLQCRALRLHHTSFLLLRPRASWSKLSSSQVLPAVQPSNMATNA